MRRRTLLKRLPAIALPLVPSMFSGPSENEPDPSCVNHYVYIGDVPAGATVALIDEIEDDAAVDSLEKGAETLDEPGDVHYVGILQGLREEPEPLDFTALPYSRPSNAPDGYYIDVGRKVVLVIPQENNCGIAE